MKKRKRKSGTSLAGLACFLLAGASVWCVTPLGAAGKKAEKPESSSVIAGTVFRESGFAIPGADVILQAAGGDGLPKGKKLSFSCNLRGEFAFRLPAQEGKFVLTAAAKGYVRQQKPVETHPGERVDVTFTLVAESNK